MAERKPSGSFCLLFQPLDLFLFAQRKTFRLLCLNLLSSQAAALDQRRKLQRREHLIERLIFQAAEDQFFQFESDGYICNNRCQFFGEKRALLSGDNLFFHFIARQFIQVFIEIFDRFKLCQQFERRLFAHSFDSGDIIRGIAHQPFQIDDLPRL